MSRPIRFLLAAYLVIGLIGYFPYYDYIPRPMDEVAKSKLKIVHFMFYWPFAIYSDCQIRRGEEEARQYFREFAKLPSVAETDAEIEAIVKKAGEYAQRKGAEAGKRLLIEEMTTWLEKRKAERAAMEDIPVPDNCISFRQRVIYWGHEQAELTRKCIDAIQANDQAGMDKAVAETEQQQKAALSDLLRVLEQGRLLAVFRDVLENRKPVVKP